METSDVKLLGVWPSPYVIRVQMALKMKSIEYEFVETNPTTKSELLLESNPVHKKIPVLIHADKPICESLVIVQYIDDVWINNPSILPTNPYDRSTARFWAAFIDDKLLLLFKELKVAEDMPARMGVIKKMSEVFVLLEEAFVNCSKGKSYFGGDDAGYLDIVLGCYLGWMKAIEIRMDVKYFDEIKTPGLLKWTERLCSESAVRDLVPATQKLLKLLEMLMSTQSQTKPVLND